MDQHGGGAEHPGNRLNHAGGLAIQKTLGPGHPLPAQRYGNRSPFRKVLNTDADRQGNGRTERGRRKNDAQHLNPMGEKEVRELGKALKGSLMEMKPYSEKAAPELIV